MNDEIRVGQGGGTGDDGANHGGDYNKFHHNTLYNSTLSLIATNEADGWGATNNTVKDNIFQYSSLRIAPFDDTPHNSTTDYNLYPATSKILNNRVYYTLSAWQVFYGQDAESIEGNAIFVGGSSPSIIADYALASGSLGKNAASDGRDMGADISLVGIKSAQMPTPQNVTATKN